ncbi:MAG: RagB/SusD family nutrient uptake outer membrane protein [Gemmatimonadaceae bacterium]|nr:RagB/SusD family nutrient uptake outer membrane protein [Gemmatimonadaceae bacterium]
MASTSRSPQRTRAVSRATVALVATAALGGCGLFDTDIKNPTAVEESSLTNPAAAANIANGLQTAVTRAFASFHGAMGTVTDELTWIGSREYYNLLDGGDITDPLNEYFDVNSYPFMAEARWLSTYSIQKLEGFEKDGTLRNRADLARTYIAAATTYITIGESYDDFVVSADRQAGGAPVGPNNMRVMFDSAVVWLGKANTIATALGNADLRRQALGLRARARHSAAMWAALKPARTAPAQPLVNNADASADATAALALMSADYRYRINTTAQNNPGINAGFEINQRLEIRAGATLIVPDATGNRVAAGLAGIRLLDPVGGAPDATLARAIDECCRSTSGQLIPFTVTSAAEMNLILAEAALAQNNTAEFTTRINAARAANAKPAWSSASTVSARDLLIHERRVHLFLSGRRLWDLYRFNQKADRWLPTSIAYRKACFVPIPFGERQSNPESMAAGETNVSRPSYCS